ncbi:MAG: hypothetical protein JNJ57_00565 [Saprospiraceae bacterium]|nr:hypothetical protein [Saprospiraceae bacterium]
MKTQPETQARELLTETPKTVPDASFLVEQLAGGPLPFVLLILILFFAFFLTIGALVSMGINGLAIVAGGPFVMYLGISHLQKMLNTEVEVSLSVDGFSFWVKRFGWERGLDDKQYTWDDLEYYDWNFRKVGKYYLVLKFKEEKPLVFFYPQHRQLYDFLLKHFPEKQWKLFT